MASVTSPSVKDPTPRVSTGNEERRACFESYHGLEKKIPQNSGCDKNQATQKVPKVLFDPQAAMVQ